MISDEWLKKLSDSKMTILPGGLMDGVERISATEMADEIISLRSQKKALIEDGERLFHSLCAYLDYCQCADIKYKCYDPVGAIEHHRALLKEME